MPSSRFGQPSSWTSFDVAALSSASKFLMVYGALMWLACGLTYLFSLSDVRALREVGIWVKPMKFMAATALFAWTTIWVTELVHAPLTHGQAYRGICILLVVTSFFEVAYITYQAPQGAASHDNTSDTWHAFMFGLMGIVAVGLTASQGWLAWEIWKARGTSLLSLSLDRRIPRPRQVGFFSLKAIVHRPHRPAKLVKQLTRVQNCDDDFVRLSMAV
jgi:hypothetical protein